VKIRTALKIIINNKIYTAKYFSVDKNPLFFGVPVKKFKSQIQIC